MSISSVSATAAPEPPAPASLALVIARLREVGQYSAAAVEADADRCMRDHGFRYDVATPASSDEVGTLEVWEFPNQDDGTATGYVNNTAPSDAGVAAEPQLPASQGPFPTTDLTYLIQNFRTTAIDRVFASSEWTTAEMAWSRCMNEAVYKNSNLLDPINFPWPEPRPSIDERLTAAADWACKKQVELPDIGRQALDREFALVADESSILVDEIVDELDAIQDRATLALQR